jgi:O-succinylhomoserine sulfhydrylase
MEAQSARALALAEWLQARPAATRVYYPSLPSHPQHALAMAQQRGQGGAVVSFVVRGDTPEQARLNAFAVIDATRICSISANLGDTKTIVTHPASTSHGRLTEEQRLAAGITQGLVRVAVGLEDVRDVQNDLDRGLAPLA